MDTNRILTGIFCAFLLTQELVHCHRAQLVLQNDQKNVLQTFITILATWGYHKNKKKNDDREFKGVEGRRQHLVATVVSWKEVEQWVKVCPCASWQKPRN